MKLDIPAEQEVESTNKEDKQSNYSGSSSSQNKSGVQQGAIPGRQGYDEAIKNSMRREEKQQPIVVAPKLGRNELVKISNGKETKEMKYKKAQSLLESGIWRIVK